MRVKILLWAILWIDTLSYATAGAQSAADQAAGYRALEAESASRLQLEGAVLYQNDPQKSDAYSYCRRAVQLAKQGEFRLAIRAASMALFLGKKNSDLYLQSRAERDLAMAYSFAGDLEHAKAYAESAISDVAMARPPRNFETFEVSASANKTIGDVYLRQGKAVIAIQRYEEALRLARQSNSVGMRFSIGMEFLSLIRTSIANALLANGDVDKAKRLLLELDSESGGRSHAYTQRALGNVAIAEKKWDEAISHFKALASAQGDTDSNQLWALDGIARAKRASGDQSGALSAYLEAVGAAERIRARFHSDEFRAGFFGDTQRIFDELIELMIRSGHSQEAFDVSERSRSRALLDMVRDRIAVSFGDTSFPIEAARSTSWREVIAMLPPNAALVVYHVLPSFTVAWTLRRSGIAVSTLQIRSDQLASDVLAFREAIQHRTDATAEARMLYETLISPLGLEPGESLIIVPYGPLHYLPFQALKGPNGYLAMERAISYAPSASALVAIMARDPASNGQVVAFGDPDLGSVRLALPGAAREVEEIQKLFPKAEVYERERATKTALIEKAPESWVLHLAAHADLDAVDPLHSSILLSATPTVPGTLEAAEVYGLNLHLTRIAALSGCDTGLGNVSRGDEIWGFTRSFLGAGVSTLLVSLWPVEDASTERLMAAFYREVRDHPANEALRTAQRAVFDDTQFRDPFFWAAFDLMGDWRALNGAKAVH